MTCHAQFGERQPQHMMCRDVGVCMALLGDCYGRAGDIDDGIRLIDRSLEHLLPLVSEEDGIIAEIRSKLDTLRRRQRMREEGLGLFLSLCDEGQRIYQQDGREADAVPVLRQAVEEGKRLPNWESEPEILVCMAQLSDALRISQDMDASFEVGLETLPLLRAQFGEEDPRVKALEVRLVVAGMQISVENPGFHEPYRSGVTHYEAHQYQEAVQFFENAVQVCHTWFFLKPYNHTHTQFDSSRHVHTAFLSLVFLSSQDHGPAPLFSISLSLPLS